MDEKIKEINKKLAQFWDFSQKLTDENRQEVLESDDRDIRNLAPSEKLYLAVKSLGKCDKVLDYGCGIGWASMTAAEGGTKHVKAVDLGENIIESIKFLSQVYGVSDNIEASVIKENWLEEVSDNSFDGIVCSNVLDVLPLETSRYIIKQFSRIAKKDATIVIGLNYYISPEVALKNNMPLENNKYLFMNDILRLTSLSDQEWKDEFSSYFDVQSLDYFAWPGEAKEARRLFILKKK